MKKEAACYSKGWAFLFHPESMRRVFARSEDEPLPDFSDMPPELIEGELLIASRGEVVHDLRERRFSAAGWAK